MFEWFWVSCVWKYPSYRFVPFKEDTPRSTFDLGLILRFQRPRGKTCHPRHQRKLLTTTCSMSLTTQSVVPIGPRVCSRRTGDQLDTWPELVRSGMRKALKTNCSVTSPQRDRHVSPSCRLFLWSFSPLHVISISALPQAHRRSTFDLKVGFILAVESKYGVNLSSSSAVAIARAGHVVYVHMRSHVRCRVWGGYLEVMCQVVGQVWNKRVTWNCTPFRFLLFLGVRETLLEWCSSVLKWLTRAGSFLTWCSGYVPFSQITYIYSRELIVSGVVRIF